MLSYQHAYHAGGPADVHKHMVLAGLLARLTVKARPITYVESHAGRGLYDLGGAEAARTGEAAAGIARLAPTADDPFGRALLWLRAAHGPDAYPGSPMVARSVLRAQDRIVLMELHPAEHAALRETFAGGAAEIHRRDGLEGMVALAPFRPRRGLVLIDPSYELKDEYDAVAAAVLRLVAKWPQAAVLIWYPLLPAGRHRRLIEGVRPLAPLRDEVRFTPAPAWGMFGSGLMLINAPYGSGAVFGAVHQAGGAIFQPVTEGGA